MHVVDVLKIALGVVVFIEQSFELITTSDRILLLEVLPEFSFRKQSSEA